MNSDRKCLLHNWDSTRKSASFLPGGKMQNWETGSKIDGRNND